MRHFVSHARPRVSLVVALLLALGAGRGRAGEDSELRVRYDELIDTRAVTHSGRTVGDVLSDVRRARRSADRLDLREGRAAHEATEKSRLALVEPFLETRAFVLDSALVQKEPSRATKPLVEVAALFPPGSKQPAWADLLRTRYFVVL